MIEFGWDLDDGKSGPPFEDPDLVRGVSYRMQTCVVRMKKCRKKVVIVCKVRHIKKSQTGTARSEGGELPSSFLLDHLLMCGEKLDGSEMSENDQMSRSLHGDSADGNELAHTRGEFFQGAFKIRELHSVSWGLGSNRVGLWRQ